MPLPTTPPPRPVPAKKTRGRWFKVRVIGTVLILVIGFGLYLNWRNSLPPREVGVLSQGQLYLDVPLMTFYTFGALDVQGFHTSVEVSFAPTSLLVLAWEDAHAGGLPVSFVVSSGGGFESAGSGGFAFFLGGAPVLGPGSAQPGISAVLVSKWVLNYTVREMAFHDWLSDVPFLEVDVRPSVWGWSELLLPGANTTAPSASDLAPVGSPVRGIIDPGIPWSMNLSVHDLTLPQSRFVHVLPPITFPGGSAGPVTVTLSASFSWSKADTYKTGMWGSGAVNLSYQPFVDLRFGSIVATYLSA